MSAKEDAGFENNAVGKNLKLDQVQPEPAMLNLFSKKVKRGMKANLSKSST